MINSASVKCNTYLKDYTARARLARGSNKSSTLGGKFFTPAFGLQIGILVGSDAKRIIQVGLHCTHAE